MKKFFAIIALATGFASVFAASAANGQDNVTKELDLKDFTGIQARNMFDVTLKKADTFSVEVSVPEVFEPYMYVAVDEGKLVLDFRTIPVKVRKDCLNPKVTATVCMPAVKSVELDGMAHLTTEDDFDVDGDFSLVADGNSRIRMAKVDARKALLQSLGTSKATLDGSFVETRMVCSGASQMQVNLSSDDVEAELSGTAFLQSNCDCDEFDAKVAGTTKLVVRGKTDDVEIGQSGASNVNLLEFAAKDASVKMNGACFCKLNVSRKLEAVLSGMASLQYKADGNVDTDIRQESKGSVVRKLD